VTGRRPNEWIPGRIELSQEEFSVVGLADGLAEELGAVERSLFDEKRSQWIVFLRRWLNHDLAAHAIDQLGPRWQRQAIVVWHQVSEREVAGPPTVVALIIEPGSTLQASCSEWKAGSEEDQQPTPAREQGAEPVEERRVGWALVPRHMWDGHTSDLLNAKVARCDASSECRWRIGRCEHVRDASSQVSGLIAHSAVGKVDDVHFLKQRATAVQISNQFKYISNEFPLTILFVGIDLKARGLYSDGTAGDSVLGQSGRRITPLRLREFTVQDAAHRREWRQLLLILEKRIVLAHKERGMLVDLSDLLWARSSGRIGSLTTLISRACHRAVRTGKEYIDAELLQRIPLDVAANKEWPNIRTQIEHGRTITRCTRQRSPKPAKELASTG
jgi:hypothetical protein